MAAAAAEEQANELEALESIYGAYFAREGPAAFGLLLEPELDAGPKVNHVAVRLHAAFPAAYPDEPPVARLSIERGLPAEQLEALRTELAAAIEVRRTAALRSRSRARAPEPSCVVAGRTRPAATTAALARHRARRCRRMPARRACTPSRSGCASGCRRTTSRPARAAATRR